MLTSSISQVRQEDLVPAVMGLVSEQEESALGPAAWALAWVLELAVWVQVEELAEMAAEGRHTDCRLCKRSHHHCHRCRHFHPQGNCRKKMRRRTYSSNIVLRSQSTLSPQEVLSAC
jgi:hypothetical protein